MDELDCTPKTVRRLSAQEFDGLMEAAAPVFPWALGVSGGSDSMALMVLSADWAARHSKPLPFILTVDHGLRGESAHEAETVGEWSAAYGLLHHVLPWTDAKPAGGVQAAARHARYHLLAQWCLAHKVRTLMTAHTEDDQAETLLLRLGRGSGVDGLSAMALRGRVPLADPQFKDISLLRPLLSVRRERLRSVLADKGQAWIEDPSNDNDHYARVRVRKTIALLSGDGIETGRLAETARRMSRVRQALESAAEELCAEIATFDNAGFVRLDGQGLSQAPEELGLRVLAHLLMAISGSVYPPRLTALERLYEGLVQSLQGRTGLGSGRTLAGCRIVPVAAAPGREGHFLIVREMRALSARLRAHQEALGEERHTLRGLGAGKSLLWDNRFALEFNSASFAPPEHWMAEIHPLGQEGWRQVNRDLDALRSGAGPGADVPALVRPTLPALWVEGQVAAVPHFNHIRHDLFPTCLAPVSMEAVFVRG